MTAGSGVVHEEKNEEEFTKQGGTLELIQLWVNLPAKYKMVSPKYQDISSDDIPKVALTDNSYVRVIAGSYQEVKGPANAFTSLNVLDFNLSKDDGTLNISVPDTHHAGIYLLSGHLDINNGTLLEEGQLISFSREGYHIRIKANSSSKALLISGEVIDEPIASYGPFVMNTEEELRQAFDDYRSGKMGQLAPI